MHIFEYFGGVVEAEGMVEDNMHEKKIAFFFHLTAREFFNWQLKPLAKLTSIAIVHKYDM